MNEIVLAGKVVGLFLGISYGFACVGRGFNGESVSQAQIFIMTSGIVTFVTLQWLI